MVRKLGLIIVTAILVSAFWIFYMGITGALAPAPTPGAVTADPTKKTIAPNGAPIAVATTVEVGPAGLAIPVAGVKASQLTDNFTQARAGGSRFHDAIDIMAAEGTPVVAATGGTVEKLYFSHGGGGISAYVLSPDQRWTY